MGISGSAKVRKQKSRTVVTKDTQGGAAMIETSINSADLSWEQAENYPSGTMRKTLRKDSLGNTLTMLLKLPPGFTMDGHSHIIAEHHYLLEGECEMKGEIFRAGHYHFIPVGRDSARNI